MNFTNTRLVLLGFRGMHARISVSAGNRTARDYKTRTFLSCIWVVTPYQASKTFLDISRSATAS